MRNKICASCKRKINDDDACVFLRKENGTNYVFDSYVCAEIFQKLNHIKRNVNIRGDNTHEDNMMRDLKCSYCKHDLAHVSKMQTIHDIEHTYRCVY